MRGPDRSRFFFPIFLSGAFFALYGFLSRNPRLIPPFGDLRDVFGRDFRVLLFLGYIPLTILLVRAFDAFLFDVLISRRRRITIPPLLREIVALFLYALILGTAVHEIFGVNLNKVFTGGAVLAAILGLALQETLGNLFAGIALHLEESFELGDVIRSGEFLGRVEHVTWRATRIRTFNNEIVLIPNSVVARDRLEVFPRANLNARVISFPVSAHADPEKVSDVLRRAATQVEGVAREIPCLARITGFTENGVTYEIKYHVRDYMLRDRIDADIRGAVWQALRRNRIALARTLTPPDSPASPPEGDGMPDRSRIVDRLRAVPVLAPVSENALEALAASARVHTYRQGERILAYGGEGDSMFVIHRGTVSVSFPGQGAALKEFAQLGEGSVFGEMALLTGETRTAEVVALSEVTAIEIDKGALQPLLVNDPQLAAAISSRLAGRAGSASDEEPGEGTIVQRMRAFFGI